MSADININFDEFVQMHKPQLIKCSVPENLWFSLYQKLKSEGILASIYKLYLILSFKHV